MIMTQLGIILQRHWLLKMNCKLIFQIKKVFQMKDSQNKISLLKMSLLRMI